MGTVGFVDWRIFDLGFVSEIEIDIEIDIVFFGITAFGFF